jgi:hypothetical protein
MHAPRYQHRMLIPTGVSVSLSASKRRKTGRRPLLAGLKPRAAPAQIRIPVQRSRNKEKTFHFLGTKWKEEQRKIKENHVARIKSSLHLPMNKGNLLLVYKRVTMCRRVVQRSSNEN